MSDQKQNNVPHDENEKLIAEINKVLKGLQYGSIEIIVQDKKVVQIERREKFRLV